MTGAFGEHSGGHDVSCRASDADERSQSRKAELRVSHGIRRKRWRPEIVVELRWGRDVDATVLREVQTGDGCLCGGRRRVKFYTYVFMACFTSTSEVYQRCKFK